MVSGEMGHRVQALGALGRAAAISNSAELRREAMTALTLPDLRLERELSFASGTTLAIPDPSFERMAVNRGRGPVEIRSLADNQLLAALPASTNLPVSGKDWSADGRFLAVKRREDGQDGDWEVWDVAAARLVLQLRNVSSDALAFHPRLPRVIARNRAEGVAIWNLENGETLVRFPRVGRAAFLRFSPDGARFAAISTQDGGTRLSVHDAANPGAAELASRIFEEAVTVVAWHPDGRWLIVPDHGGAVHWVEAQTGEVELLGRHKALVAQAVFSPDGAYLFTGGFEREIICWDARTKRRAFTASLNSHLIQFSADGRRCAVSAQTTLQLHTFVPRVAHREFADAPGSRLREAKISPDGRWLAASDDKRAGVWDLSSGGPGAVASDAYRTHFYFTPDGRELFGSRRTQGDVAGFRWRLNPALKPGAPPELTRLPLRPPLGLTSLSLASNAVVMTAAKGSLILRRDELDALGERPGLALPGLNTGAADLLDYGARWAPTIPGINGVSPDGRWLGVYRPYGSTLHMYRLPGLEPVAKLTHPVRFGDFQFSPLGDELAITSMNAGILATFWNTTTWEQTRALTNFTRVLYPADARTLWLAKDLRSAGLYDARTLEPLLWLPTGMLPLALSSDGQRVAVSVDAQRLQLWDLRALREQFRELGVDWADGRK
jgi:WD40 repeat protein